jgi:hypothetical protein
LYHGINLVQLQIHGPIKKFYRVFGSTMLFILLNNCHFLMPFSILWIYYLSIYVNGHLPFSDFQYQAKKRRTFKIPRSSALAWFRISQGNYSFISFFPPMIYSYCGFLFSFSFFLSFFLLSKKKKKKKKCTRKVEKKN